MKEFHFRTEDAKKYGVDGAVILYNIRFWVDTNAANKINYIDGRYWTYNTAKAFARIFPFWKPQKIARLLRKLEDAGAIISANHNVAGYDQTKWYSVADSQCSNLNNGILKSEQPIPDSKLKDIYPSWSPEAPPEDDTMNEEDGKKEKELPQDAIDLAEEIVRSRRRLCPSAKNVNAENIDKTRESWASDIDKIHRLDGKEWQEVEKILKWALKHKFWERNVQSGSKLRAQYDNLYIQMMAEQPDNRDISNSKRDSDYLPA
jgi:hypothetical protein